MQGDHCVLRFCMSYTNVKPEMVEKTDIHFNKNTFYGHLKKNLKMLQKPHVKKYRYMPH